MLISSRKALSITKEAKFSPALSFGEDAKGMNDQTPFPPPLHLCDTGEKGPHKSGKAENARFFHESSIENSHLAGKGDFKSSEGQLADFSLELSSATNNLLLLLPSLRLCCAITQFRALRRWQRIERLFLFITILIIFLAGLKSSLICYHLLSLLITMALQINKVKSSSSISVKTYTRALHFKWQCSHRLWTTTGYFSSYLHVWTPSPS